MAILSVLLGFFGKIITGVFTDALKTPAIKTQVDDVAAAIETKPSIDADLIDQYSGLLDRG
jgi:hypothetical protein